MPKLNWDANDFQDSQDSSGTTADNISHDGNLQQGYRHGSLTEGLVAYYPMEKGEGEVLHDGAFDNLGQIEGNIEWSSDSQVSQYSLDFKDTQSNKKINLGNSEKINFNEENFTLSCWVKFDASNLNSSGSHNGGLIQNRRQDKDNIGYQLFLNYNSDSDADAGFALRDDNGNSFSVFGNSNIGDNQWHLVTATRRNGQIEIYIDGDKDNTNSESASKISNTDITTLGSYLRLSYNQYYPGKMKDVRFYNRALSQPEIKALYNLSQPSGVQKTEKNVPSQNQGGISRWKFDDPESSDAIDSWGSNPGTINGASYTDNSVYDQALLFADGESDWVDLNDKIISDGTNITLSMWWNESNNDGRGGIFQRVGSNFGRNQWHFGRGSPDSFVWQVQDAGGNKVAVSWDSVNDKIGEWTHILGIFNKEKKALRLYINGKLIGSDQNSSIDPSDINSSDMYDTRFARRESTYWNGKLDDIRLYEKALTPLQVEKLYHKGAYRISRESTLQ